MTFVVVGRGMGKREGKSNRPFEFQKRLNAKQPKGKVGSSRIRIIMCGKGTVVRVEREAISFFIKNRVDLTLA